MNRAGLEKSGDGSASAVDKTAAGSVRDITALKADVDFKERASRYQAQAEADAALQPALAGVAARPVAAVGVIGAGTMGCGIAIAALGAGFTVILIEQDEAALARGMARVESHFSGRIGAGKMSAAEAAKARALLSGTIDWQMLAQADLIIEAVFEDIEVKRAVFKRLDGIVKPGALLASNTSYLDVDAIAAATTRPGDVIGLHFFSPANVMKLMEVVRGKWSKPDAVATGLAFAQRLRKVAVVTGNAFGFVGNRVYSAYRRQCEFMMEEGATPEQIDGALEGFGFAMGPFTVADMSGLDIAWRMRQSQAAKRDPTHRYVAIADRLCEAGRLGRKTGAGYYRYVEEGGKIVKQTDPAVAEVIAAERRAKGVVARAVPAEEICSRALLAMVNEAALLLAEGVATRASDVDVVLCNGYGFPRWAGGVVFWARQCGAQALAAELDGLARASGAGFVRGDIGVLLADAA